MDLTAIATTMPLGRYGARHIDRWSVSVAIPLFGVGGVQAPLHREEMVHWPLVAIV